MAERLDSAVSKYHRIEHGLPKLTLRTLVRIAGALGVPVIPISLGQRAGRPVKRTMWSRRIHPPAFPSRCVALPGTARGIFAHAKDRTRWRNRCCSCSPFPRKGKRHRRDRHARSRRARSYPSMWMHLCRWAMALCSLSPAISEIGRTGHASGVPCSTDRVDRASPPWIVRRKCAMLCGPIKSWADHHHCSWSPCRFVPAFFP